MKKLTLALLGLLVLLIPLLVLGCETATPTQTAPLFVTTETYNAGINAIQAGLNGKANQTDLNTIATDVATLKGQGAGNTYTKGELYTRAEVDAAIAAAINALKTNQAWITGSTGGTTTPTTGGTVTWITSPTNVQILGNTQVCYTVKVTNNIGNWVYVRPIINVNASTGQSPTTVTKLEITIGGSAVNLTSASGVSTPVDPLNNFDFAPTIPTVSTVTSTTAIATRGGNGSGEFQLAANSTVDLLICIKITAAANIIWNIGTSMNWRSL